jgi:hypothetical protein
MKKHLGGHCQTCPKPPTGVPKPFCQFGSASPDAFQDFQFRNQGGQQSGAENKKASDAALPDLPKASSGSFGSSPLDACTDLFGRVKGASISRPTYVDASAVELASTQVDLAEVAHNLRSTLGRLRALDQFPRPRRIALQLRDDVIMRDRRLSHAEARVGWFILDRLHELNVESAFIPYREIEDGVHVGQSAIKIACARRAELGYLIIRSKTGLVCSRSRSPK